MYIVVFTVHLLIMSINCQDSPHDIQILTKYKSMIAGRTSFLQIYSFNVTNTEAYVIMSLSTLREFSDGMLMLNVIIQLSTHH